MIAIKPIGMVHGLDERGFIVNPCSHSNLRDPWLGASNELKTEFLNNIGEHLHSIYLRGSVPKGAAISGLSDLDCIVLTITPVNEIDMSWIPNFKKDFRDKYPEINDCEILAGEVGAFKGRQSFCFILKTQCLCIWGTDLSEELPSYKPGVDAIVHSPQLLTSIERARQELSTIEDPQRIMILCGLMSKRMLRTGYEIVMEEDGSYTRDLYPCWQIFSKYYPDRSDSMREALFYALNPTSDKTILRRIIDDLGEWLIAEISKRSV